jgi:hypothetical protein
MRYSRLAATLPANPRGAPRWVSAWVARERALGHDVKSNMLQIGLTDCA